MRRTTAAHESNPAPEVFEGRPPATRPTRRRCRRSDPSHVRAGTLRRAAIRRRAVNAHELLDTLVGASQGSASPGSMKAGGRSVHIAVAVECLDGGESGADVLAHRGIHVQLVWAMARCGASRAGALSRQPTRSHDVAKAPEPSRRVPATTTRRARPRCAWAARPRDRGLRSALAAGREEVRHPLGAQLLPDGQSAALGLPL